MKQASGIAIASIATSLAFTTLVTAAPEPDYRKVSSQVGDLLEKAHYSKRRLDDSVSKQFLKNYLERLDYNHLFFTQKDVDNFNAKFATTLDEEIAAGNTKPAIEVFEIYRNRVEERVAKAKELLKEKYDFTTTRAVEWRRDKAPWPRDAAEADQLWRDRIESELLDRTLMEDKVDPPLKVINRRYDQILRNLREQTNEDIISTYLAILAETYDPHSEYMSRSQLDSFNINMRLSLVGIGAVLTQDEGYTKIRELVPGGPASEDGRIKVGDRIAAVAQADGEFVEALDMRLDKVVEMIRGKKDTVVRLKIIPTSASDPSERKIIEITRREVKLKEQEAKAEIIERTGPDGQPQKLGWIILPSFYADMERSGKSDAKSTTKDVLALVERLKKENVQGIVMDLRRNGGGSLEEAVNLTGLFIKEGYVVVARDTNGRESKLKDRDRSVAYDGPMVVLTNKLSASASEIFAAALQDYNRAVVVGDSSTFGKGTVQTMVDIGNMIPNLGGNGNAGALKLTIQKFYRISGGSTQLKGVVPDIKLPSLWDQGDIGESALKNPMGYDTIEAVTYDKLTKSLFITDLKQRSTERVAQAQEFKWINEDAERMKKRVSENKISLNEKSRRAEIEEDKSRKEARKAERAKLKPTEEKVYVVTLDNAATGQLELKKDKEPKETAKAVDQTGKPDAQPQPSVAEPNKPAEPAKPAVAKGEDEDEEMEDETALKADPIRRETINILNDLIQLGRNTVAGEQKTAQTK